MPYAWYDFAGNIGLALMVLAPRVSVPGAIATGSASLSNEGIDPVATAPGTDKTLAPPRVRESS